MIDVDNIKIKEILKSIHLSAKRRERKEGNEKILLENMLYACLCQNIKYGPSQCANYLCAKYGCNLSVDDVIMMFRNRHIAHPVEREDILHWAEKLADIFEEAINGNYDSFACFELMRRKSQGHYLFNDKERILAIMLYEKYPELNEYGDKKILMTLNSTLSRYYLYDLVDAMAYGNGFPTYKERNSEDEKLTVNKKNTSKEPKLTYDEVVKKMHLLENSLDRTNSLLQELQDEFDEQINASKAQELAEFFAQLNSDKYGFILDEMLVVRKGINELKKRNYELPIEINGLIIMVKKLIQFVQDSHINPMMKVDSLREVKASDVEFCNYEGSPFTSEDEIKTVRVISPGWIYKDKELQISRPKLKEE